ncbi:hypothetical protein KFZ70_16870 [Tamlana fucoidanivorans]|uniref:Cytochrome c n=1 Tax=Allotamlana fucoidanivorans TaxID=2583814 RepID=A0A5C4SKB7_9FLAO|nr:hypothetical protein [Tamlana fucoidanivorans]TNJ43471.1 hypothetical protein FGF67_11160 [Tamlana fucoidanivorans]
MKYKILIFTLSTISFYNCANDSEDDLTNPNPIPTVVTYNAHVKSIINTNCTSCHSDPAVNGANVPLTTYTQVKSAVQNNNLISKINGNGPGGLMPLGGPKLPENLIDVIEKWETDGLKEN